MIFNTLLLRTMVKDSFLIVYGLIVGLTHEPWISNKNRPALQTVNCYIGSANRYIGSANP